MIADVELHAHPGRIEIVDVTDEIVSRLVGLAVVVVALGLVTERGVELNPKSDTEIKKTDKAVVLAPARPSPVRA